MTRSLPHFPESSFVYTMLKHLEGHGMLDTHYD
jgi:hypothetical protein